jgi:group I intron endonuclease
MTKNMINAKKYVGFHMSNKEFHNEDYIGSGILFNKKVKEYGRENFIMGILEYINEKDWRSKEQYWIKKMHSHVTQDGYNLTWGGDGGDTFSNRSDEDKKLTVQRLSKPRTNGCSEERKAKISAANTGNIAWNKNQKGLQTHSEKTKEIMRKNNAGTTNPMYNKKHTKESILKMSLSKKGKPLSEETKQKLSLSTKGIKKSEETKIKMRIAFKSAAKSICPHCNKSFYPRHLVRWHGENCKSLI